MDYVFRTNRPHRFPAAVLAQVAEYVCSDSPGRSVEEVLGKLTGMYSLSTCHSPDGSLQGFLSLGVQRVAFEGRSVKVTVPGIMVKPAHRNRRVADRLLIGAGMHYLARNFLRPGWGLAVCGQYRSYRLTLKANRVVVPSLRQPVSGRWGRFHHRVASAVLKGELDGAVVRGSPNAIEEAKRPLSEELLQRSENARFFVSTNPGYVQGDALVCLTRVSFIGLIGLMLRRRVPE